MKSKCGIKKNEATPKKMSQNKNTISSGAIRGH